VEADRLPRGGGLALSACGGDDEKSADTTPSTETQTTETTAAKAARTIGLEESEFKRSIRRP